jgi:cytochrome c553
MLALSVSPMSAVAAPSSEVAFDLETIHLLRTADVARGEELVKEYKCSKCHGDAGISEDPEEVNRAGQLDSYLYKQLQDYHHGKRLNRSMQRACKNITDQDMANIASWYASLDGAKQAETQPNENTLKLVYQGDPTRLLKSCRSCHGRKGEGGQFQHPAIAGQNRDYFIETMTAFKEGDRENDVYSRMRIIAEQLTTEEIEALATFYAAYITPDPDQ